MYLGVISDGICHLITKTRIKQCSMTLYIILAIKVYYTVIRVGVLNTT